MNARVSSTLSRIRLLRPLATPSPHYRRYQTDGALIEQIQRFASNILLAGHRYDLELQASDIFQVASNRLNRMVYVMPIWRSELVRQIVTCGEHPTKEALNGCGLGALGELEYAGGILVLKRSVFRGTERYLQQHGSSSEWFVEDRYHLDVIVRGRAPRKGEFAESPAKSKRVLPGRKGLRPQPDVDLEFRPGLRVFHDSIGCRNMPSVSIGPDIATFNDAVDRLVPQYFPEADDVVMTWHEVAALLGFATTGIYGLAQLMATQEAGLIDGRVRHVSLAGEYLAQGQAVRNDLRPELVRLGRPLPASLLRNYRGFLARYFTDVYLFPPALPYVPNTRSQTRPPSGPVGQAVIELLLSSLGTHGVYLGDGLFHVLSTNGDTLVAGSGHFGSAEYGQIGISTSESAPGIDPGVGGSDVQGRGPTGLTIDLLRYALKEEVDQAIAKCRQGSTSAECQACVGGSVGDVLFELGVVADVVDFIGGIVACVVAAIFGQAWVCGLTIPASGASAEAFWGKVFSGYSYEEDMCYGLPDSVPTGSAPGTGGPGDPGNADDVAKRVQALMAQCKFPKAVTVMGENIVCFDDAGATVLCGRYGPEVDGELVGGVCRPGSGDEADRVICVYCIHGNV